MKKGLAMLLTLLLLFSATAFAEESASTEAPAEIGTCNVQFGADSAVYTLHFYDNETALALLRQTLTTGWNLPIYDFDGYDGWEVMTYYDISSRYDIPDGPVQHYDTQTAGQLYYSSPNRLMLFYGDAEMPGDYTLVGYFENTDAFRSDVANNQPLEYWGNKLVMVTPAEQ